MQTCVLQSWGESVLLPTQSLPPYWGAGFVHVLFRHWDPPPHVTEQSPQDPHVAHSPSTTDTNYVLVSKNNSWMTILQFAISYRG